MDNGHSQKPLSVLFGSGQIDKLQLLACKRDSSLNKTVRDIVRAVSPFIDSILSGNKPVDLRMVTTSGQVIISEETF